MRRCLFEDVMFVGSRAHEWVNKACLSFSAIAVAIPSLAMGSAYVFSPDEEHAPVTRRFQGIPSIAVSQTSGRMWCTWYAGPSPREDENNYCVLATSTDDGRHWREVLVADPDGQGGRRAFDPEVWIAPDGKLRWTWAERLGSAASDPRQDILFSVTLSAEDDPATPFPTPCRILKGVMMCKPTVLSSGEWLYPLCEWQAETSSVFHVTTNGERFMRRGGVVLPKFLRQFDEGQVIEKRSGELMAFVRTSQGLAVSSSANRGVSWTEPLFDTNLVCCATRIFVRRLMSGNILMVKNGTRPNRSTGRTDLTAFLSRDDGATWEGGLVLDKRAESTYPDGDQGADGLLYVVYDHERTGERDVLLSCFTEADVLKGADVSGRVRLRQAVICVPTIEERKAYLDGTADLTFKPPRMMCFPEVNSRYAPENECFVTNECEAMTVKGKVWRAWTGGGKGAKAYVLASRSDKGGKGLVNPMLVLDGHLDCLPVSVSVDLPSICLCQDGSLRLRFVQTVWGEEARARQWETICGNPDDEFPTWTSPRRIDEPDGCGNARFVNPFIGTAGTGHSTPAACVPFGLVQAGPDKGHIGWEYCSGYRYGDKTICGFSQTHLNGTGWMDLGDVLLLPVSDGLVDAAKTNDVWCKIDK